MIIICKNERRVYLKISIITIWDPIPNYGNRLQNYAAQKLLKKYSDSVETIAFEKSLVSFVNTLKYYFFKACRYRFTNDKGFWQMIYPRAVIFKHFEKKYLNLKYIYSTKKIRRRADYFAIGSDQVWNPMWYANNNLKCELYFLSFTDSKHKICISPSFGVSKIPKEWEEWFKIKLDTFDKIAVREKEGVEIVKDLIGKKAQVLIDPTLMLDKDEWDRISKRPSKFKSSQYVLLYFLGEMTLEQKEMITELKNKQHMDIINIFDRKNISVGPSEFIYLISNAKLVLTDSFHACVFSFLYGIPFLVYDRAGKENKINSRIVNFVHTFDLERKYVKNNLNNELFECDYSSGYVNLKNERIKYHNYLTEIIK